MGGGDYIEYVHNGMALPIVPQSLLMSRGGKKMARRMMCTLPTRGIPPPLEGGAITSMKVPKQKRGKFFALVQMELGDVYKVMLVMPKDDKTSVISMMACLLDTLPICNELIFSQLGYLFVLPESGNHRLYQFNAINIKDKAIRCMLSNTIHKYLEGNTNNEDKFYGTTYIELLFVKTFQPTALHNLHKVSVLNSLLLVTSVLVDELKGNEDVRNFVPFSDADQIAHCECYDMDCW